MIKERDGIAVVDAAQLLNPEQRKMADTPRVIVEPTAKLKKTVSASIHFLFAAHMRKISHFQLEADFVARFGLPCSNESILYS